MSLIDQNPLSGPRCFFNLPLFGDWWQHTCGLQEIDYSCKSQKKWNLPLNVCILLWIQPHDLDKSQILYTWSGNHLKFVVGCLCVCKKTFVRYNMTVHALKNLQKNVQWHNLQRFRRNVRSFQNFWRFLMFLRILQRFCHCTENTSHQAFILTH
jgi:hypothetical protein